MEQREVALKTKVNSEGKSATGTINLSLFIDKFFSL